MLIILSDQAALRRSIEQRLEEFRDMAIWVIPGLRTSQGRGPEKYIV